MCLGTNAHVSAQTRLRPHVITCQGKNVSGHKHMWAQSCLGTNVSGHKRVWAQTSVGTNECGHKRVWAQTHVGTNVPGHNRVVSVWIVFPTFAMRIYRSSPLVTLDSCLTAVVCLSSAR